ncbi:MAG: hypothetical protein U0Y68_21230 [Blastocatellia bacterium]
MRGQLLVFKPVIVARRDSLDLTATARHHPLVLDAEAFTETVRVKLPSGFEVDESPTPPNSKRPSANTPRLTKSKTGI